MRYQGKITSWKDDKGFGFIATNGRSEKAFVHIKAFTNHARRPAEGDLVTYELTLEEKGRYRADKVKFVEEGVIAKVPGGSGSLKTVFAILFCCVLALLGFTGRIPLAVTGLYAVASTIAFIAYAIDKAASQSRQWRTRESTLHVLALIGGWPGALLAQGILRHKSKKQKFQLVFWITVLLNFCALVWLFAQNGFAFIQSFA
ncbi:Integral membrane protein [Collimonas arenae]|uniref:Integral membrane protein n=2 Tax=Collimonas arenae TaxID=279058 RepID=A0A0A1FHB6_9BURK|nr:Integral membrane protein [Collimonas arenae]